MLNTGRYNPDVSWFSTPEKSAKCAPNFKIEPWKDISVMLATLIWKLKNIRLKLTKLFRKQIRPNSLNNPVNDRSSLTCYKTRGCKLNWTTRIKCPRRTPRKSTRVGLLGPTRVSCRVPLQGFGCPRRTQNRTQHRTQEPNTVHRTPASPSSRLM